MLLTQDSCRIAYKAPKLDKGGGFVPQNFQHAKAMDLITLPVNVKGTNCSNCKWISEDEGAYRHCSHEDPRLNGAPVNKRMCCKEWDAVGSIRAWEKGKESE